MNGSIQIATYHETDIKFELRSDKVMINATEMADAFNGKPVEFLRNTKTKAFIKAILSGENSHQIGIEKESDLLIVKPKSGTWMHRVLALKFAAWLSPEFEVWIYSTIEEMLYGDFKQVMQCIKQEESLNYQIASLKEKLRTESEDFRTLEKTESLYRLERRNRKKQFTRMFDTKVLSRYVSERN